jgi:hypothetical protein
LGGGLKQYLERLLEPEERLRDLSLWSEVPSLDDIPLFFWFTDPMVVLPIVSTAHQPPPPRESKSGGKW